MKKILLIIASAIFTLNAAAQTQVNFNVNAGIGMANLYGKNTDGADAKFAYKVGVGMEVPFDQVWSLQTGLNFTSKGCSGDNNSKINALYLELPVMAGARIKTANNFNVLLKAGPYFAYGVGGKTKIEVGSGEYSEDTFGDDGLKRFDAGLGCGIAFEFSQIVLGLEGNFGLTNISDGGDDFKPKNINALFTVGYKF